MMQHLRRMFILFSAGDAGKDGPRAAGDDEEELHVVSFIIQSI